jgi:hypothetical protein
MILAKISPHASIVKQSTPFDHVTEIAEYMTVYASPYIPNADVNAFIVQFGNIPVPVDGEPAPPPFVSLYAMNIDLTSAELNSWGTDDRALFEIVAEKINVEIISYA